LSRGSTSCFKNCSDICRLKNQQQREGANGAFMAISDSCESEVQGISSGGQIRVGSADNDGEVWSITMAAARAANGWPPACHTFIGKR
jgi:hypothetical protein